MPGRLYSLFRRIAMLGPTEEEMARMDREDREACKVPPVQEDGYNVYYGITAFGQRVEEGDGEDTRPPGRQATPGRLYSLFRRIAMLGPTEEEMARMDREDREACKVPPVQEDGYNVYYGITAFGQRVEDNDEDICRASSS
ncbi:MAG: hypothetical protein OXU37_01450 [Thaumarchaeota archaeon]|nr:hypothetical protein [Nitrososphaerota archaeon]